MTQEERRLYLIRYLINEDRELAQVEIPWEPGAQKRLLRSLMNIRQARPISREFLRI